MSQFKKNPPTPEPQPNPWQLILDIDQSIIDQMSVGDQIQVQLRSPNGNVTVPYLLQDSDILTLKGVSYGP